MTRHIPLPWLSVLSELGIYVRRLTWRSTVTIYSWLGVVGTVTGLALIAMWDKLGSWDGRATAEVVAAFVFAAIVVNGFAVWRAERERIAGLETALAAAPVPILEGGPGGHGGAATVYGDGNAYGGRAGRGGNVVVKEGEPLLLEGGKAGEPGGPAPLDMLARASLGTGLPLAEFLRTVGFDPSCADVDRIGRGGDGGSTVDGVPSDGTDGGPGLIVAHSWMRDASGNALAVVVFRPDGYTIVRNASHALAMGLLAVENIANLGAPGDPMNFTLPPDFGA